jgi:peroxiredoxin (alkyl hydroperoxide reductase subunit C)
MITEGKTAPDFTLKDQFGRDISLSQFRGKRHVLLLFYPLDFTPT